MAESDLAVDYKVRRALRLLAETGATVSDVSIPWHTKARGVVWGLIAEGATGLLQTSGTGRHFEGQYNPGLGPRPGAWPPRPSQRLPADGQAGAAHRLLYDRAVQQSDVRQSPECAPRPAGSLRRGPEQLRRAGDAHHADARPPQRRRRRSVYAVLNHGWDMVNNTGPFDMTGHPGRQRALRQDVGGPARRPDAGGPPLRRRNGATRRPRLRASRGLGDAVGALIPALQGFSKVGNQPCHSERSEESLLQRRDPLPSFRAVRTDFGEALPFRVVVEKGHLW